MAVELEELTLPTTRLERDVKRSDDALMALAKSADKAETQLIEAGRGSDKASRDLKELGDQSSKTEKKLGGLGAAAKGLFAGVSVAIIANELRKAVEATNAFEVGLVAIGKTADLSEKELQELGDRIDKLSRMPGMPQAAQLEELGKVAGQLGVKGVDNITIFTETMAKLGSATDLVGEEGATSIAKLLNITGESVASVATLGSVIVALGNNFSTTERQIAFHAQQVARATAVYEIGSAQSAAYATVLSAFGVRAELAGSSIGRMFRVIEAAVKGGGDDLETLARVARTSGAELTDAFERGPVEAVNILLKAIRDIDREKGNVPAALKEIGLSGQEVLQVIPVLAKEFDTLARAQKIAAAEVENATALDKEFAKSAATRAASMQQLGNTLDTVQRLIGDFFAPAIASAAKGLSSGLDAIIGWRREGAELDRLLDELAPSADETAKSFRNLADEIERSAEASTLIAAVAAYNQLFDELDRVQSRLAGLTDEELAGVIGIKLTTRVGRLQTALEGARGKIDEARVALSEASGSADELADSSDGAGAGLVDLGSDADTAAEALKKLRRELREAAKARKSLAEVGSQVALESFISDTADEHERFNRAQQLGNDLAAEMNAKLAARKAAMAEIETAQEKANRLVAEMNRLIADGMDPEKAQKWLAVQLEGLGDVGNEADEIGDKYDRWAGAAHEVADIFFDMNTATGDLIGNLAVAVERMLDMRAAGESWASSIAAGAASLLRGAISTSDTDYGGEGSQLGGAIGGLFGPGGELLGTALGFVLGSLIDKGVAVATTMVEARGQELVATLTSADSELSGFLSAFTEALSGVSERLMTGLNASFSGAMEDLAVRFELTPGLEEGQVTAIVNGLEVVVDNVQDAVAFALVQAIHSGAVTGLSPEAQALIGDAAFLTAEELDERFALALRLESGRLGASTIAIRDTVNSIFNDIEDALKKGVPMDLAMSSLAGSLEKVKAGITGTSLSAEEQFKLDMEIFNSTLVMRKAELALKLALLEADRERVEQLGRDVPGARTQEAGGGPLGQAQDAIARGMLAIGQSTVAAGQAALAGAQGVAAFGNVTVAASSAVASASATMSQALVNALAALEAIEPILASDFNPGGSGGSIGNPAGAARRAERARLDDELEGLRRLAAGYDETTLRQLEFVDSLNAVRERAQQAGWSGELLAERIQLMRDAFADAELARELEETARAEEEAAEAARRWTEEVESIRDAISNFGGGPSGALGSMLSAVEQAEALLARLAELPQQSGQFAADVREIGRALREQLQGVASGLVSRIIDEGLERRLAGAETDEERLAIQQEIGERQVANARFERSLQILELENVKLQLIAQGAMTRALAEQIEIAQSFLEDPIPDFVEDVTGAGQDFANSVVAAAAAFNSPNSAENAQALLDVLTAMENTSAALSGGQSINAQFAELQQQAFETRHAFFLLGTSFEEVTARIEALRQAELRALFADTVGAVQDDLSPGGALSQSSNRERLARLQEEIQSAIASGDFARAAQLARSGLSLAGETSSRIFGEFSQFVQGLSIQDFDPGLDVQADQLRTQTDLLNAFEKQMVDRQRAHGETEKNRFMQTEVLDRRLEELTDVLRGHRPLLKRIATGAEPGFDGRT